MPVEVEYPLLQNKCKKTQVDVDKLLVCVATINKGVFLQSSRGSSSDSKLVTVHKAGDSQLDYVMIFVKLWKDALRIQYICGIVA